MNNYPRHVGDYIRDTVGLSMLEEGAYTRLLDQYYARELPLPREKAQLYRLARATTAAERKAVDAVIAQFFLPSPDGHRQSRADRELAKWYERSESARQSAQRRWSERNAKADANAMRTHMPTDSEGNATQYPVPNTQGKAKARASRARALPEGFALTDRVRQWAAEKGLTQLPEHFEHFVSKAKAKGYRYADWEAALMNAIRDDWAGLRTRKPAANVNDKRAATAKEIFGNGATDEHQIIDVTPESRRVA